MKRMLFVCHGNICRSVMAEFIMKDIIKNQGDYVIASAATSYEEVGNDIYYEAKKTLDHHHIPYTYHPARHIEKGDLDKYDLIIGMDQENIDDLNYFYNHSPKIHYLLEYCGIKRDVIDPWYSREFEKCYDDLYKGCLGLYQYLEENH